MCGAVDYGCEVSLKKLQESDELQMANVKGGKFALPPVKKYLSCVPRPAAKIIRIQYLYKSCVGSCDRTAIHKPGP